MRLGVRVGLTLAGTALLAACGGGVSGGEGEAASGTAGDARDGLRALRAEASVGQPGPGRDGGLARVVPRGRQVVHTAQVTVETRDVSTAAARAEQLALGAGGMVSAQDTSTDSITDTVTGSPAGPADPAARQTRAELTLRVPPEQYRQVLRDLAELGRRLALTSRAEDVTQQVVDVEARLQTQQDSVQRLRALLAEAESVSDVISIESELSQRIADLEALEARQQALTEQVAMTTITVLFLEPEAAARHDASGFLAGLRAGWQAFTASLAWLATAVGAVLPFAAVLVVLWLAYRLVRQPAR
ncbi:MAG: DUF4349 domain-containing protein [Streptomycetales bacterium]